MRPRPRSSRTSGPPEAQRGRRVGEFEDFAKILGQKRPRTPKAAPKQDAPKCCAAEAVRPGPGVGHAAEAEKAAGRVG